MCRRTTTGSWASAAGRASTWANSSAYWSVLQPNRVAISSARGSSDCHHVRSNSSIAR